MSNEEIIKYLIKPFATSTRSYNEYLKQREAYDLAVKTLKETDNHGNCVLTMFGECSYKETGCSDCKIKEKIREALKNDRPKGKWIVKGRWHIDPQCIEYTCSICGREIMREESLDVIERYPFCHCGADMRGEENE